MIQGRHLGSAALALLALVGGFSSPRAQAPMVRGTSMMMGRVLDATTGRPVAGARVAAYGLAEQVLTDSEGRFAFFDLNAGTFRIVASKPGYVRTEFGQQWATPSLPITRPGYDPPLGHGVVLGVNERRDDLVLRLWKSGVLTGQVFDDAGEPAVGVLVQAWPRMFRAGRPWFNNALPAFARTDDRGLFRIPDLVPGDYIAVVPVPAVTTPGALTPPDRRWAGEWSVELLRAQRLYQNSFPSAGSHAAVSEGEWLQAIFGPLPPHSPSEPVAYSTVFFPGVPTPSAATVLHVAAGETRSGLDFRLVPRPARSVSGMVHTEGGHPAGGVTLRLLALSTEDLESFEAGLAVSNSEGRFRFAGVAPGRYRLRVLEIPRVGSPQFFSPAGSTPGIGLIEVRVDPWSDSSSLWAVRDVVVPDDQDVDELRVDLATGHRITGVVRFTGPSAPGTLSSVRLDVERLDGRVRGVRVSNEIGVRPTGELRSIELPPGRYLLRSVAAPSGWTFQSARWRGRDVSVVPVDLSAGATDDVVVTYSAESSPLTGRVRAGPGVSLDLLSVAVFPVDRDLWVDYGERPRTLVSVPCDKDGGFVIPHLPPMSYFVAVIRGEWLAQWHDAEFLAGLAPMAQQVDVPERGGRFVDLSMLRWSPQ